MIIFQIIINSDYLDVAYNLSYADVIEEPHILLRHHDVPTSITSKSITYNFLNNLFDGWGHRCLCAISFTRY